MIKLLLLTKDHLSFEEHINTNVASANNKLGIIRNTFYNLNKNNVIVLDKSFVRHTLEYCCTTWSPLYIMYHKEMNQNYNLTHYLYHPGEYFPWGEHHYMYSK